MCVVMLGSIFFFSFKLSSVGVSGRWGDVRLKDKTQFLTRAGTAVKQLWVLCVRAGSGASGHKEMGENKRIIQVLSERGAGSSASRLSRACALRLTTQNTAASMALSPGTFHGWCVAVALTFMAVTETPEKRAATQSTRPVSHSELPA